MDPRATGHGEGMKTSFVGCKSAVLSWVVSISISAAGCDLGDYPIGETPTAGEDGIGIVEGSTGASTDGEDTDGPDPGTTEGGSDSADPGVEVCDAAGVDFGFELTDVEDNPLDLSLTCTASVGDDDVALTGCTDDVGASVPDRTLTLTGDWTKPLLLDGQTVALRYVEHDGELLERWLTLSTDTVGGALVAIDAATLQPPGDGFDFGGLSLDDKSLDCPPLPAPPALDCTFDRLAVVADFADDVRDIPDGTSVGELGSAGTTRLAVVVAQATEPTPGLACNGPTTVTFRLNAVAYTVE